MATLKQGSKGSEVSSLQQQLSSAGYNIAVDGIYGPETAAAVKAYQQSQGLSVDGIVGNQTWGSLNAASSAGYGSSSSYTSDPYAGQSSSYSGSYSSSSSSSPYSGLYSGGASTGGAYPGVGGQGYSDPGGAGAGYADPAATDGGTGNPAGGSGTGSSSGGTSQWREYPFDQLMANLDMTRYEQKSTEQLEAEARGLYDPIYNAEKQGLTHQAEQNALMLEQELGGLGESYDRQREDTAKSFADAYSQAGNSMLSRGLQRSSYGEQIQSNISIAGSKAQNDINQAQTNAETKIRETASMYDRQFQESLTRLAADYQTNVTNYRIQLEQREYDRYWQSQQAMNQLNLALYQASLTEAQFEESIRQFNTQMGENQRQFNLSFGENQRQFNLSYALQQQQLAEQARQFDAQMSFNYSQLAAQQAAAAASAAYSGGGGGSGSSSKSTSTTTTKTNPVPGVTTGNLPASQNPLVMGSRLISSTASAASAAATAAKVPSERPSTMPNSVVAKSFSQLNLK
jgi:peptidoglycan hydrolase-like protein with peptidoglycan-binding domain